MVITKQEAKQYTENLTAKSLNSDKRALNNLAQELRFLAGLNLYIILFCIDAKKPFLGMLNKVNVCMYVLVHDGGSVAEWFRALVF